MINIIMKLSKPITYIYNETNRIISTQNKLEDNTDIKNLTLQNLLLLCDKISNNIININESINSLDTKLECYINSTLFPRVLEIPTDTSTNIEDLKIIDNPTESPVLEDLKIIDNPTNVEISKVLEIPIESSKVVDKIKPKRRYVKKNKI